MSEYQAIMGLVGTAIDALGVVVIALGALVASGKFVLQRQRVPGRSYSLYRQDLGRVILLGLEFLIAGDIIRTVVVSPTLENLYVLGMIVLIRTFLSFTLQLELEGRWPWQTSKAPATVAENEESE